MRTLHHLPAVFLAVACLPVASWAGLFSGSQLIDVNSGPVAVDGNCVVIGNPGAGFGNWGNVHVFERGAGGLDTWAETKFLVPSDRASGDLFGNAVAIHGDTLIIGADFKDGTHSTEGAAYIFERDAGGPGNWGEVVKLTGPSPGSSDHFGEGVGIHGDTAVVTRSSHPAGQLGAAFVYERDAGGPDNWGLVKTLTASDGALGDRFRRVAIHGDTIVIGAAEHAPGGQAYVYERDAGGPGNWGEVKVLTASDPGVDDDFGFWVAIHADTIVVGRPRWAFAPTVAGAAYVFEHDAGGPGNWGEVKKIPAPDGIDNEFGATVAVDGDRLIVVSWNFPEPPRLYERDLGGPDNWGKHSDLEAGFLSTAFPALSGDVAALGGGFDAQILYTPMTYMFVTAGTYPADFGGLAGGDAICRAEATAGGLPGLWRSFLSVLDTDRFDRVPGGRPVATIAAERISEDEIELNGPIASPLDDEPGGGVAPTGAYVWTGGSTGALSCESFSATTGTGGFGIATQANTDWHAAGQDGCTSANRLYCVQFACPENPDPLCDDSWASATLLVKENRPGQEKLTVKLNKGPGLTQLGLGAPLDLGGTAYLACLYDGDGQEVAHLRLARAGDLCDGKPCWLPLGAFPPEGKGFQYRDRDRESDGLERLRFIGGAPGKSKILLKAANNVKKGQTTLPVGIAAALSGATSATLQLHVGDLGTCHSASFGQVKKDTGDFFKAIK